MHETHNGIEIRALLPDADKVEVIDKESQSMVISLERVDERGFFSAIVPNVNHFFAYQFKVYWGSDVHLIEDPYRFHPMINDLDQWLLAEGSLLRPYEVLGAHFTECDGVPGVNFRVWAPNANAFHWWVISTIGTVAVIQCVSIQQVVCGNYSYQKLALVNAINLN